MTEGLWHVRDNFLRIRSSEAVRQFWEDDDLNRRSSLDTFEAEMALVDEGLVLYVEAIQGASREGDRWKDDTQLRASIAMLMHALNVFFAWRHLLMLGYLAEARLLARSIHESLSQALVFTIDKRFAEKFYRGDRIRPKEIRDRLSKAMAEDEMQAKEILCELRNRYGQLSAAAHPTLNSFSMRTIVTESGSEGLAKLVPEGVIMGGLLSTQLGRVVWLSLARDVAGGLAVVRQVVKEATGSWDKEYEAYRKKVRVSTAEAKQVLDRLESDV